MAKKYKYVPIEKQIDKLCDKIERLPDPISETVANFCRAHKEDIEQWKEWEEGKGGDD
jgi:hypothetical protein